jgi:hypothetical protein
VILLRGGGLYGVFLSATHALVGSACGEAQTLKETFAHALLWQGIAFSVGFSEDRSGQQGNIEGAGQDQAQSDQD